MQAFKLFFIFILFNFSSSAMAVGHFGINAYQAGEVTCNINNQFKSRFSFDSNNKRWIESTADRQRFMWHEAMRDEWSIYLDDRSRGYVMQIDLHTKKVSYGQNGNRQQYFLCTVSSAKVSNPPPRPKPKPRPVIQHGQFCANERGVCEFRGEGTVTYGAGSSWTSKRLRGPVPCNNQTFGDPARGVAKSCFVKDIKGLVVPPPPPPKQHGQFCSKEHGVCQFRGTGTVSYGADNRWVTKRLRGPVQCNNRTFGDPARGSAKSCFVKDISGNVNPPPPPPPQENEAQYDIQNVNLNGLSAYQNDALVKWVIAESMRQEQPMCWKKSKPNTAGKPLSSCPANKTKSAGLCYNKCKDGYTSDGAMLCYKKCPKGTKTSPGFCHFKFGSIGKCPSPLKGLKPACMNTNSYNRGVGKPMTCAPGQVQKGALCYPQCPSGFSHGGPVCWQTCSDAHPVDCGAGCSQSSATCAKEITKMVLATGELVANIAGFALTGGAANAGMKTAKTAMKSGQKVAARIALKKALKVGREQLSQKLQKRLGARVFAYVGKKSGRKQGSKLVQDYAKMVFEKASQKMLINQMSSDPTLAQVASMIDPTGVVDVVNAYNKPICEPIPMPR